MFGLIGRLFEYGKTDQKDHSEFRHHRELNQGENGTKSTLPKRTIHDREG